MSRLANPTTEEESKREALEHFLGFKLEHARQIHIEGRPVRYLPPWEHPADYEFDGHDGESFLYRSERLKVIFPKPDQPGSRRFTACRVERPPLRCPPGADSVCPVGFKPRLTWYQLYCLQLFLRLAFPVAAELDVDVQDAASRLVEQRNQLRASIRSYFREHPGFAMKAKNELRGAILYPEVELTDRADLLATYFAIRRPCRDESVHALYLASQPEPEPPLPRNLMRLLQWHERDAQKKRGRPITSGLVMNALRTIGFDAAPKERAMLVALEREHISLPNDQTCYFSDRGTALGCWRGAQVLDIGFDPNAEPESLYDSDDEEEADYRRWRAARFGATVPNEE